MWDVGDIDIGYFDENGELSTGYYIQIERDAKIEIDRLDDLEVGEQYEKDGKKRYKGTRYNKYYSERQFDE